MQILIFYISSFIFKENHILIEEDNPSEKIVIVEEELDSIDRDGNGNLEDLQRLVLINENGSRVAATSKMERFVIIVKG